MSRVGGRSTTRSTSAAGGCSTSSCTPVASRIPATRRITGRGGAPSAIAPGEKIYALGEMKDVPVPRSLTTEAVRATVRDYAHAAQRAVDAGADGVEIHGIAYLIHQFPAVGANRRTDRYGGSLQNRVRFAIGPNPGNRSVRSWSLRRADPGRGGAEPTKASKFARSSRAPEGVHPEAGRRGRAGCGDLPEGGTPLALLAGAGRAPDLPRRGRGPDAGRGLPAGGLSEDDPRRSRVGVRLAGPRPVGPRPRRRPGLLPSGQADRQRLRLTSGWSIHWIDPSSLRTFDSRVRSERIGRQGTRSRPRRRAPVAQPARHREAGRKL